ncbi:MAG: Dam family site-specific DNA-(adenine-N6)-methyltransferase [Candidatus Paceibacterota bacterium]|jgi:DNA adenine methylase
MNPKPFVKWAGGKTYLLPELHEILSKVSSNIGYCEPMVGGGALYWTILEKFRIKTIADVNADLIDLYKIIRDVPEDLIAELLKPEYNYVHKSEEQSLTTYRRIRASVPDDPVKKAARTMFLLRTCFNGLMRVNKHGQFNVPPGSYKNPEICNAELIRCDSIALQGTVIYHSNAIDTIHLLDRGRHLLFVDPPYYDDKKKFTGYSGEFTLADQTALINCVLQSGQPFIYTNKAHPSIIAQFDGIKTKVVPLRHSVQPLYTTDMLEDELIAWRT